MKTHHFPILIEQDEDNIYIVTCPTFKGCHSYGKTIDEAIHMEEQQIDDSNNFVGFREIEVPQKASA